MVLSCDLASWRRDHAVFGIPRGQRGLIAGAADLSPAATYRSCDRAMMALTAEPLSRNARNEGIDQQGGASPTSYRRRWRWPAHCANAPLIGTKTYPNGYPRDPLTSMRRRVAINNAAFGMIAASSDALERSNSPSPRASARCGK